MQKTQIRIAYAIVAAALGLALSSSYITAALADSPKFHSTSASVDRTTGQLVCSFFESGLGNSGFSQVSYTCTANASATYQCFNNGGNHPKAGNKETVGSQVGGQGTFPVNNGNTQGTIRVNPPSPGDFSCPNGQTLFLVSVTYSNIVLCDAFNNCVSLGTATANNLFIRV